MDSPTANSLALPIHDLANRIHNNMAPNNLSQPLPNNPQIDVNSRHNTVTQQPMSQSVSQHSPPMSHPSSMSPTSNTNSTSSVQDTMLSKQLQAMMLETAKQQVHVDTSPLDEHHRFKNPSDFLQYSLFTSAIRERIRGRIWNAKFEAWIAMQFSLQVEQMYTNLIQTLPIKNDYQPVQGFYSAGVRFAGCDDFEFHMYNYFFGTEQMQCRVLKAISNFHVGSYNNYNNDDAICFDTCTSLCNVAIRAFDLLNHNPLLSIPQMIQASLVTNQLPKFAITKLKEWHPDVNTRPQDMTMMMTFVKRVDDNFDRKPRVQGVLKSKPQFQTIRGRPATPHPRGKRNRSRGRSQTPYHLRSRSPMRSQSRSRSPFAYRTQSHYKGSCAKCGKMGHSIAQCRNATDEEKQAFFLKVKESKAKANDDNNKSSKASKKVKYASDAKTYDGPSDKNH